jgi:hypothetical protein
MRRTTINTSKDQKTSSRGIPHEGKDHIHVSSAHTSVSKKIRTKDRVPPTLPRQGETSSCHACIKLHGGC